ncbi:hypothetical protein ABZP36_022724 [Zizania latifolia]
MVRETPQKKTMDSKQLMPSNSGANRALASGFLSAGRELCSVFSTSCFGGAFSACVCCFPALVLHESRVEYPAAVMSAGDELRIEKARILSMIFT